MIIVKIIIIIICCTETTTEVIVFNRKMKISISNSLISLNNYNNVILFPISFKSSILLISILIIQALII